MGKCLLKSFHLPSSCCLYYVNEKRALRGQLRSLSPVSRSGTLRLDMDLLMDLVGLVASVPSLSLNTEKILDLLLSSLNSPLDKWGAPGQQTTLHPSCSGYCVAPCRQQRTVFGRSCATGLFLRVGITCSDSSAGPGWPGVAVSPVAACLSRTTLHCSSLSPSVLLR